MRAKKEIVEFGQCALTELSGKYVKAHIIPKALTTLTNTGKHAIQTGLNRKQTKRLDSWYDTNLVIETGEKILSDIDTKGISELRKYKLIWSGWDSKWEKLPQSEFAQYDPSDALSLRSLQNIDINSLRVFFLSILWRSAASQRNEMSDITLSPNILEKLRLITLSKNAGQHYVYPIKFHQISTRGPLHNRTPILEDHPLLPEPGSLVEETIPICRLYFNGLVTHIILTEQPEIAAKFSKLILGVDSDLIVLTKQYSNSRELSDVLEIISNGK
ncbi:hypothetical protein AAEY46_001592 [Yersinia enterocolitica]